MKEKPWDRGGNPPADTPEAAWTWPAVTVTCVLVLAGLITAVVLVFDGVAPKAAAVITVSVVAGVVACVVVPIRTSGTFVRRLIRALNAFTDTGSGSR